MKPRVYYNAARVYAQASVKMDAAEGRGRAAVMYPGPGGARLLASGRRKDAGGGAHRLLEALRGGGTPHWRRLRERADMTELAAHYAPPPR